MVRAPAAQTFTPKPPNPNPKPPPAPQTIRMAHASARLEAAQRVAEDFHVDHPQAPGQLRSLPGTHLASDASSSTRSIDRWIDGRPKPRNRAGGTEKARLLREIVLSAVVFLLLDLGGHRNLNPQNSPKNWFNPQNYGVIPHFMGSLRDTETRCGLGVLGLGRLQELDPLNQLRLWSERRMFLGVPSPFFPRILLSRKPPES